MTTLRRRLACRACGGKGLFTEDYDGVTYSNPKACTACGGRNGLYRMEWKGSGKVDRQFDVGNEVCRGCQGTGKVEVTCTKSGTNFLGQRTRKSWKEVIECPDCLGVKHELFEIETHRCKTCDGRKTVKQWVKGFFGGEVEKDVPCSSCKGQGTYTQPSQRAFRGVV